MEINVKYNKGSVEFIVTETKKWYHYLGFKLEKERVRCYINSDTITIMSHTFSKNKIKSINCINKKLTDKELIELTK